MAWISWSRNWPTRRTTTTSRKPPRCSSTILRWNRMHVLLQAEQRPKQNHKDVLLPARLQGLYPSGKELGLLLSQKIVRPSLTQCQNNWPLFFVMVIYLKKMMERLNFGDQKIFFGANLSTLIIGLMKSGRVKWQEAEAARKDFNIVLWSIRTRNSLPPSSSRSFRTQSCWSFITGQCTNSERFLRVHLSHRMCNQFALHHEFRIDTRRTKFEQNSDDVLHICGAYEQGTQRSRCDWPGSTASCMVEAEKSGRNIKTRCIGSTQNLLNRKDLSSIKHDRTQPSFTTRFQLVVSRRLSWWKLEKSYTRKYMRHLDLLRRFPLKTIGWKNWVHKLLGVEKTPKKPNQRPKIQLLEQGDLFWQSNHPVRVLRKSKNVSYLAAKAPMREQGDLFPFGCQCLLNV